MNNKPVDYEKTIDDTVKKISDFYIKKLEKNAKKLSVEKYNELYKAANSLVKMSKLSGFYEDYVWYRDPLPELFNLSDARMAVDNFFGCVRDYKKAKARNSICVDFEEKSLASAVKRVNIKFGNEFIGVFKDLFLPNTHFVSR